MTLNSNNEVTLCSLFPSLAVQCERKPLILTNGGMDCNNCTGKDDKEENSSDEDDSADSPDQQDLGKGSSPTSLSPKTHENSNQTREVETGSNVDRMEGIQTGQEEPNSNSVQTIRPTPNRAFDRNNYNLASFREHTLAGIVPFQLDPPYIPVTEAGYLYELSTRLLFATIDWVKGLLCFNRLCDEDKIRLLAEKWYLLFSLGILQCSPMYPVSTLLALAGADSRSNSKQFSPKLHWQTFLKLKSVIMNGGLIGRVGKDIHEYMKIVTLFDQGKIKCEFFRLLKCP